MNQDTPERMTVGKIVQEALEKFYMEAPEGRSDRQLFSDYAVAAAESGLSEASVIKGSKMLGAFWDKHGVDEWIPAAQTELDLRQVILEWGGDIVVEAQGILDGAFVKDGTIYIIENKTSEKPDLDYYPFFNPQIYDYGWLAHMHTGLPVAVVHNLLSPTETFRFVIPISEEVLEETGREWGTMAIEIYGEELPITYNRRMSCARSCGFYSLCYLRLTGGDVEGAKQLSYGRKDGSVGR